MIESMSSSDFVVVCDDRKLANWNKDMELPKIPPEKRKKSVIFSTILLKAVCIIQQPKI